MKNNPKNLIGASFATNARPNKNAGIAKMTRDEKARRGTSEALPKKYVGAIW
jgi:hypothetical protein